MWVEARDLPAGIRQHAGRSTNKQSPGQGAEVEALVQEAGGVLYLCLFSLSCGLSAVRTGRWGGCQPHGHSGRSSVLVEGRLLAIQKIQLK